MDEFREKDRLHSALDATLSGLNGDPWLAQRVLAKAKGEEKVKKKLSAGFVLAMVLVLIAAVALAVATISETGRLMAQTEQENGDYINWPTAKKVQVVTELMDEGYLQESAELTQLHDGKLSEADANRVANTAIETLTGEPAENASFLSMMNAVWGSFEQWTSEQQAWYSQVMKDVGATVEGKTYYVMPTGEMTKEEAIAIAKREIARGFGMEDGLVDKYRVYDVSYQIPEFAKPGDTKAYWYVALDTWGTELADQTGLPIYSIDVFVDPDTGLLLQPIEEQAAAWQAAMARGNNEINIAVDEFLTTCGEDKSFEHWSLENKARWSEKIAPMIRESLKEHPEESEELFNLIQLASIDFHYAMPDAQAISQERALAIARDTLQSAYQLSDEEIALLFDTGNPYYTCIFYDVTDSTQPLWKFLLLMPSNVGSDEAIAKRMEALYGENDHDRYYKVEMNAYTGEVTRVLKMRYSPDSLEGYKDIL